MNNNFFAIVNKVQNISSFNFANLIKKALNKEHYDIKKVGFLGTLDPFASGNLILAFNTYTKLLSHINTDYKTYIATLFLGMQSESLDIENVKNINIINKIDENIIKDVFLNLKNHISYLPPKFSAKKIEGVRAYKLARSGMMPDMKEQILDIKSLEFLNYCHPFISFKVSVAKGGYIRSLGEIITQKISEKIGASFCDKTSYYKTKDNDSIFNESFNKSHKKLCEKSHLHNSLHGSLCYLHRLQDGNFSYLDKNENLKNLKITINGIVHDVRLKMIDLKNAISYDTIDLTDFHKFGLNGRGFSLMYPQGRYIADFGEFYAVIDVNLNGDVKYIINRIGKC